MKTFALLLGVVGVVAGVAHAQPDDKKKSSEAKPEPADPIGKYFKELEAMKLIDVESGNVTTLRRELASAETLLKDGAFANAAVALYAIVKSPRYTGGFTDFVEYQNAEYDLGVALARAGSYGAALDALEIVLKRGPAAPYYGPAHRRIVDIAIETRDHAGVLARIEAVKHSDPLPVSATGERAYLRGRAAYDAGKLADAEGELVTISKKSRMYSSGVYLRGVIRARRGELKESAEAMCEIAATPDNDKFTFVVDDRYFTVKDLARLGLGRIAHESGEYDDAYYHYFQIPDDSMYLGDALFEASWSMYQKRELPTSRDLVKEFLKDVPVESPLWPEAELARRLRRARRLQVRRFAEVVRHSSSRSYSRSSTTMDKVRKDPAVSATSYSRPRSRATARSAVHRRQAREGQAPKTHDRGGPGAAPPRSEVHPPERRARRCPRALAATRTERGPRSGRTSGSQVSEKQGRRPPRDRQDARGGAARGRERRWSNDLRRLQLADSPSRRSSSSQRLKP